MARLASLAQELAPVSFSIVVGPTAVVSPPPGTPSRFTIEIHDPALLTGPLDLFTVGRAYVSGRAEIKGDMEAAIDLLEQVAQHLSDPGSPTHTWTAPTSTDVNFHYDLPLPFWKIWLDKQLLYTCACFSRPDEDIDVAQQTKLDRVAAKLGLGPGDHLLDVGCGWGAFTLHAAKRRGASVLGITLSHIQAGHAAEILAQAGCSDRARIEVCDFRALPPDTRADKVSAIGVVEHLGAGLQPAFFERMFEVLPPGGLLLVQVITAAEGAAYHGGIRFIREFVFPAAELVPLHVILSNAERARFEVRDVESLRRHYMMTTRVWGERLTEARDAVVEIVGAERFRAFRAYLAGFARQFEKAGMNVYQILLQKPGSPDKIPLVRAV